MKWHELHLPCHNNMNDNYNRTFCLQSLFIVTHIYKYIFTYKLSRLTSLEGKHGTRVVCIPSVEVLYKAYQLSLTYTLYV